jgi:peptidoglycan/LPS O-acetylase OafA/YrhL
MLFHGGVGWLPGGFLGVDAFFVLSGFLITSLLLHEYATTGRIMLGAFWLRRARRLLPALLVVLVFVVGAFPAVLPRVEVDLLRTDAYAALTYWANWRMIYRGSGNYFTQTAAPSPLQHTWSLGIEEQFYLVWPLLLAGLLALRLRRYLLWVCLGAAAVSATLAAVLYNPLDVNRAYQGTDTRAQALLIGCALAVLLSSRPVAAVRPKEKAALHLLAVVGLVVTAWLWTHASGAGALLYRGGLALGGLSLAAVLAHSVLLPQGPAARLLGVAPVVWLGRISYGLYLWHWPLFQYVNGDRTGLTGPALLTTRLALTLAVATASFYLLEQPVRTGRWPLPLSRPGIRVGLRAAGLSGTAVVGATAAFIFIATTPPRVVVAPVAALPSVSAAPSSTVAGVTTPMRRPNRTPGDLPRIAFFGDSVSWTLGTYLPAYPNVSVSVPAVQGCGIARLPDILELGTPHTNYPECPDWDALWQAGVTSADPDLAVVLLDRWELMDRRLGADYHHVGEPIYDAYLTVELERALSIVSSRGAYVVLLTAPYTHRAERPDGGLYDEDQPERVDAWNRLLRSVAAQHPNTMTVIDLNARVCPGQKFTWDINGLQIRSDGLHFTPEGVQQWIAPWLMPQLLRYAVLGAGAGAPTGPGAAADPSGTAEPVAGATSTR